MDRSHVRLINVNRLIALSMTLGLLVSSSGCPSLLATGIYVWNGGTLAPAACEALRDERVVVVCKPPSSQEYRHAGASRAIAKRVSEKLAKNVKNIDVVNPREVDNWVDESDWGDFRELAKAVHANLVVHVEMDNFELYKGKTLYQGKAEVTVTVYDVREGKKIVWDSELGEILYPINSGIPAQDKPPQQFEREFVEIVADRIATNFYRHDPNESFAIDAAANR